MLDLVIIGAAAAGCSAAVYAARRNLNFVVISKDIGGEVALSGDVDNWPGTIHTTGIQLADDFHKHALSYNVQIEQGLEVIDILHEKNHHIVVTRDYSGNEKRFETKTVLIGSGIHPRNLGVKGETELKGRGVTYCTVCDGPLYKNKITCTIGAGNSALESALMMGTIASKVYLITKFPNTPETNGGFPKGENILIDKVKAMSNVEIVYSGDTQEILGSPVVSGVQYKDTVSGEVKQIDVQGVMIHVGNIPNSGFVNDVTKNKQGEIETDKIGQTNIAGIFAAGDVTNIPYKQISISAGLGVTAVLAAIDYINRWHE